MNKSELTQLIKKRVRELTPYNIETLNVSVKLDAMENPYPLSSELISAIQAEIKSIHINRYPDPGAVELKKSIASNINIKEENILIGNGSDELIQIIFTALGEQGDVILVPSPTFSMYRIIGIPLNLKTVEVPLSSGWEIDLDGFLKAIQENKPKIVVLANPNNPTGNSFDRTVIESIIENAPGIVIIDEAYYNFSKKTVLDLCDTFPNLIILRTLSKIGMAGLRVGFMIADEVLGKEIAKVRLPYNINSFSQAAANIILQNRKTIDDQIGIIISDRNSLFNELKAIKGVRPYQTETNFILFKSDIDSEIIYRGLIEKGILIRSFDQKGPLANHLRVTVGTKEENKIFLEKLEGLVKTHQVA